MTLWIDQNEPISIELYLAQCMDVERKLLNKPAVPPRPDYCFLNYAGEWVGVSRKQAGEFLGAIDAAEAQLLEEMGGVDHMALLIEGWATPAEDGGAWTWRRSLKSPNICFEYRHYAQNFKGVKQKLASLHDKGVLILQTANELDTALTLVALYEEEQKPDAERKTFRRLVKEKYWLSEEDEQRKNLALSLMGIAQGGWGEEIALAAAGRFDTFTQVLRHLEDVPEEVARIKLRSGRNIGAAKVTQMRRALGL